MNKLNRINKDKAIRLTKRSLYLSMLYIILIGLSVMIMYPYIVKLITSFMTVDDLANPTVRFIPTEISITAWRMVFRRMNILEAYWNSFFVAGVSAFLQVAASSFIGYGFARYDFPGKQILFALVIFTMLVPFATVMLPYYLTFRHFNFILGQVNLINTVWPNVIVSATGLGLKNGLYIFLFRQYFRGVPKELEEAAFIDGAGPFKTYLRVMLPNATASILTVFLLAFCWQWTDTNFSAIFMTTRMTVVNAIPRLMLLEGQDIIFMSAMSNIATLVVLLPIVLIYLVAQRSFVQGIERSGITN